VRLQDYAIEATTSAGTVRLQGAELQQ
jgi:hypothetical protein